MIRASRTVDERAKAVGEPPKVEDAPKGVDAEGYAFVKPLDLLVALRDVVPEFKVL